MIRFLADENRLWPRDRTAPSPKSLPWAKSLTEQEIADRPVGAGYEGLALRRRLDKRVIVRVGADPEPQ